MDRPSPRPALASPSIEQAPRTSSRHHSPLHSSHSNVSNHHQLSQQQLRPHSVQASGKMACLLNRDKLHIHLRPLRRHLSRQNPRQCPTLNSVYSPPSSPHPSHHKLLRRHNYLLPPPLRHSIHPLYHPRQTRMPSPVSVALPMMMAFQSHATTVHGGVMRLALVSFKAGRYPSFGSVGHVIQQFRLIERGR